MKKSYKLRPALLPSDREALNEFSDVLAGLLYHRGIRSNDVAREFLEMDFGRGTHDPLLLHGVSEACERILKAISSDEKVTIYADYDADGIPGAVILHDFFQKIGFKNFDIYIPHRNREGFGLHIAAINAIAENGTKLIITIDCGISDFDQVDHANSLGIDVIITDHHEPHEKIPNAFAIVNPKHPECKYPEKMLCGSAVIFKLVQALIKKGNFGLVEGWEKWLLDMVGIATLSDMVPLVGENRVLAQYGLKVLRKSPRKGLLSLFREKRMKQHLLTEEDVGFGISPRINAASRMGEPLLAFQLLSTTDEVEAERVSKHLSKINDERKGHVAVIIKEIKKHLKNDALNHTENPEKLRRVLAMGNPSWQPSLLGLAASNIAEEYDIPVFLWGRGDGKELKGSCRGVTGRNVFELMQALPAGILPTYGGHAAAGGFVIDLSAVDKFEQELENIIDTHAKLEVEEFYIDHIVTLEDISWKLFNELQRLSPFGVGNERPRLHLMNEAPANVRLFGKESNHLEVSFIKKDGTTLKAISFFAGPDSFSTKIEKGKPTSFIIELEKSNFSRLPELRLKIIDCLD